MIMRSHYLKNIDVPFESGISHFRVSSNGEVSVFYGNHECSKFGKFTRSRFCGWWFTSPLVKGDFFGSSKRSALQHFINTVFYGLH